MQPRAFKSPQAFKSAELIQDSDESDRQQNPNETSANRKRKAAESAPESKIAKQRKVGQQATSVGSSSKSKSAKAICSPDMSDGSVINGVIHENHDSVGSTGGSSTESGSQSDYGNNQDSTAPTDQKQDNGVKKGVSAVQGDGVSKKIDTVDSTSDSSDESQTESGSSESEDDGDSEEGDQAVGAGAEEQEGLRDQSAKPQSAPAFTYQPPNGFKMGCQSHANPDALKLFSLQSLEQKQLWHIVVPKGLPIAELTDIAVERLEHGGGAIFHEGSNYQFVKQLDPSYADVSVLVPDAHSGSFQNVASQINKSFYVKLMSNQPPSNNTNTSTQKQQPPVQQPKGLKKQYWPPGFEPEGLYPTQCLSHQRSSSPRQPSFMASRDDQKPQQPFRQSHGSRNEESQTAELVDVSRQDANESSSTLSDSSSNSDSDSSKDDGKGSTADLKSTKTQPGQPQLESGPMVSTKSSKIQQVKITPKKKAQSRLKDGTKNGTPRSSSSSESNDSSDDDDWDKKANLPETLKNKANSSSKRSHSALHPNPPFKNPLPKYSASISQPAPRGVSNLSDSTSSSSSSSSNGQKLFPLNKMTAEATKVSKKPHSQATSGMNGIKHLPSSLDLVENSQQIVPETPEKPKQRAKANGESKKATRKSVGTTSNSTKKLKKDQTGLEDSLKSREEKTSSELKSSKMQKSQDPTGVEESSTRRDKKSKKKSSKISDSGKKEKNKKKKNSEPTRFEESLDKHHEREVTATHSSAKKKRKRDSNGIEETKTSKRGDSLEIGVDTENKSDKKEKREKSKKRKAAKKELKKKRSSS